MRQDLAGRGGGRLAVVLVVGVIAAAWAAPATGQGPPPGFGQFDNTAQLGYVFATDHTGGGVVCPKATLCVAAATLDTENDSSPPPDLYVFNPEAPERAKLTGRLNPRTAPFPACPSATQCTLSAFGPQGESQVVTLDPSSPAAGLARPGTIHGAASSAEDNGPARVEHCASTRLCVALQTNLASDPSGFPKYSTVAYPFDPQAPTVGPGRDLGAGSNRGMDCSSASQCTVLTVTGNPSSGGDASAVTFDPSSGDSPAKVVSLGASPGAPAGFGVSCPSATQCTTIVRPGEATTFNPQSGTVAPPRTLGEGGQFRLACASGARCVAIDSGGRSHSFDPQSPSAPVSTKAVISGGPDRTGPGFISGVSCPTADRCVVSGSFRPAKPAPDTKVLIESTFDPTTNKLLVPKSADAALTPTGPSARLGAIVRKGGYTAKVLAQGAGLQRIDWKLRPSGAKPVLVASGTKRFTKPGEAKLTIRLTAKGRALAKKAKRLKLTAVATFTPKGGRKAVKRKAITLKR